MRKRNCFARTNGEAKRIFCKNEKGEAKYRWKVRSSGLKIGFSFVDRRRKIIIHLLFFVSWFVISRCLTNTSIWKRGNKCKTGWLINQRISKILMHEKACFNYFDEGPTLTVLLNVEINFCACLPSFHEDWKFWSKDGEVSAFEKFSLKIQSFVCWVKADIYRSFWKVSEQE